MEGFIIGFGKAGDITQLDIGEGMNILHIELVQETEEDFTPLANQTLDNIITTAVQCKNKKSFTEEETIVLSDILLELLESISLKNTKTEE